MSQPRAPHWAAGKDAGSTAPHSCCNLRFQLHLKEPQSLSM